MPVKNLRDLPQDIYAVLKGEGHALSPDSAGLLGGEINVHFDKAILAEKRKPREMGKLWASDIGKPDRQTWYAFHNTPGEELQGWTKFKFFFGNVIEEIVLTLAKAAGHTVEACQQRIEMFISGTDWKVSGKIDALLDKVLVDVKSAASRSFDIYTTQGVTSANDSFGYRFQLAFYYYFGPSEWRDKPPHFVFADKSLGHIAIASVDLPTEQEVLTRIEEKIKAIESDTPPPRCYAPVPEGASGNMKLAVGCSYCEFKKTCWPEMRGFAYANGPVYLTTVAKLPKVPEIV